MKTWDTEKKHVGRSEIVKVLLKEPRRESKNYQARAMF